MEKLPGLCKTQIHLTIALFGQLIPCCCPIDSNFINLRCIFANIFDMAKYVTLSILTDEIPQICTETHVCSCRLLYRPFICRNTFKQNETSVIQQSVTQIFQQSPQVWEWKVFLQGR